MADISKCNDIHCPSKNKCYRYTAPGGVYQTYAYFNREYDADNCSFFWDNKDEQNTRSKQYYTEKYGK